MLLWDALFEYNKSIWPSQALDIILCHDQGVADPQGAVELVKAALPR
jgi:hypothetical protein